MALNWAKAARRDKRLEGYREARLAAIDPSSYVWVEEESDGRPACLVCSKGVSPDGDDGKQLASGSWVHNSCVSDVDEYLEETESSSGEARLYEVDAEVSFSVSRTLLADSPEDAEKLMREWLIGLSPKLVDLRVDALISPAEPRVSRG